MDANIFITAWRKGYPIRSFPSLWRQISQHRQDIILIKPIYDEIEPISSSDRDDLSSDEKENKYPLRSWLVRNGFVETPIDNQVRTISLDLEHEYQITDHSKGASQNDITLIAYAKINEKTVATFEAIQPQVPSKKYNYKIPLICQRENVRCIDFIALLQACSITV